MNATSIRPHHLASIRAIGASAVPLLALVLGFPLAAEEQAPKTPGPKPPDLELRVNVPAFRLDALLDGEPLASFPVAVGSPDEPTAEGSYAIDRVDWNPEWHAAAETPQRRVRMHLVTDPYPLAAARFGLPRGATGGGIRLAEEDAVALAALIHDVHGPRMTEPELRRLVRDERRLRSLTLDRPVPLTVVYEVVEIVDGMIAMHGDPYGRWKGVGASRLVAEALRARGLRPGRFDLAALAAALRDAVPGEPVMLGEHAAEEGARSSRVAARALAAGDRSSRPAAIDPRASGCAASQAPAVVAIAVGSLA